MSKTVKKRFDIDVTEAEQVISKTFELDKGISAVKGVLITADKDDLLYYRGSQSITINREEYFPDDYESKLLMSGINVSPNQRYYDLGRVSPGNGEVKVLYTDTEDGRSTFEHYRVAIYLDCETEDEA